MSLFSLLLLLSLSAQAQKRKAPKQDELETEEKAAKNVVRPEEGSKSMAEAEDAEMELLIAENEARASKVRKRQLKRMKGILKKDPLYKKRADMLFRIAEKEWQEAKYRYFLERKKYDQVYEKFLDGIVKKRPNEPIADYSKALIEYIKLLKEFPNYKRVDEVMFYLGRGLITAGKKKRGASFMLRLTKEYPKSKYITRAYLAVAEYYFDSDLLFAAKANYLKVLENRKSSQYPYALYKLGYVYYNLGTPEAYEESIKSFQKVVELQKGKDKRKVYFTGQAYAALAMTYAEICEPINKPDCKRTGWKRARDYFRRQGGKKLEVERLESIARNYGKQDQNVPEVEVYEYLISQDKQGSKVPEYADYITKSYKKMEEIEKTEEIINRFYTYFDSKGSWYLVNKDSEKANQEGAMTRAKQYREEQLDWLITQYHTKAQEVEKLQDQVRADKLYAKAARYYERYLKDFPEAKADRLYEMQFYLAEIYFFQSKEWDKAMEHYRGVVKRDPKGKYSKESAYAVILASEEKMADAGIIERPKRTSKGKKKGKGKTKAKEAEVQYTARKKDKEFKPIEKKPLQKEEEGFLLACKEYSHHYPKDEEVPFVSFRSAEIFINKGHYSEGIGRLEVIMEHHPKHKYAGHAAATLFDANYRLRRWHEMERWGRYMLDRKNYAVLNKKQLRDVIAISINEYAQELSEKGERDKAVSEMMRFVNEFSKHEKAPIALFNAAVLQEKAEKTEQAIDLYERLIKEYPKVSQATEAHFVLGALYESQTDFKTAARYFEKMASFPDVPQMADALYNAGAIRAALEQYPQAETIFSTYIKKFPKQKDTPDIYFKLAEFQEKQKDWKGALKTYKAYIKAFKKSRAESLVEVHLRMAKVHQMKGAKRARKLASKELKTALKLFKKLPDEAKAKKLVRRSAAEVRFLQGEYAYQDFEAIEVNFPYHVLVRSLAKKGKLLLVTEKIYFEVLEMEAHDVSAGALYRIGEAYYLFAKSLFDLPVPAELSEDEQIIYKAELDDKAAPLHEKAIEAVQHALKLAHKNHVYNKWSRRSASLLAKLSPDAFPILDDREVNTDWEVSATFSTTFISDPLGELKQMLKAAPASNPASGPASKPLAKPILKKEEK